MCVCVCTYRLIMYVYIYVYIDVIYIYIYVYIYVYMYTRVNTELNIAHSAARRNCDCVAKSPVQNEIIKKTLSCFPPQLSFNWGSHISLDMSTEHVPSWLPPQLSLYVVHYTATRCNILQKIRTVLMRPSQLVNPLIWILSCWRSSTGWQRPTGCLICTGHFPQKLL